MFCATPDQSNFIPYGTVWEQSTLRFKIEKFSTAITSSAQTNDITNAFNAWSAVVPLTFIDVTGTTQIADFNIGFYVKDHGDGAAFDGTGRTVGGKVVNTLAHAFYPSVGKIHFDDDDNWTTFNLFVVALHEIGHALGLEHSSIPNTVMNKYYNAAMINLSNDDISGIRFVYKKHIWVASLYRDILGRRFDVEGLDGWIKALYKGKGIIDISRGFVYSEESSNIEISKLYHLILEREAEPAGLASWAKEYRTAMSLQQIMIHFFNSPEYKNNYPENNIFINSLYTKLLDREPDPSGKEFWMQKMINGMSRSEVAAGFIKSEEYCRKLSKSMYQHFLRREPEEAGWKVWTDQLQNGLYYQELVVGFVTSKEYQQNTQGWWN